MLLAHMAGAAAPLALVPQLARKATAVKPMEGQYIVKNVVIVAATLTLLAHRPGSSRHTATTRNSAWTPT
ncbi:hypothetical protein [Streptomyces sp. NPDC091371]|uniref:hypothetical protein n=1 Tax=Streptomyces sp. NPDC091371 TaxID=3155303 RepID=UPI00344706DA